MYIIYLILIQHRSYYALETVLEVDDLGRLLHFGDYVERFLRLDGRLAVRERRRRRTALRLRLCTMHRRH